VFNIDYRFGYFSESNGSIFLMILSTLCGLVTFVGIVLVMTFGFSWKSSQHKANIINREYGTNYTKEEIFYAKGVIETIQQIDRTRIDIQ
jgi:hypothetical protein